MRLFKFEILEDNFELISTINEREALLTFIGAGHKYCFGMTELDPYSYDEIGVIDWRELLNEMY